MFSKKRFKNNQLETLLERSKLNVFLTLKYNVLHTFSYNVQSSVHFQTFKKRFQNVQQQRKITDKTKRLKNVIKTFQTFKTKAKPKSNVRTGSENVLCLLGTVYLCTHSI